MHTGFMRKVDYHVGIPVCYFFSLLHTLSRLLLRKDRTVKNPRKILFIKLFGMGTIVLATPAIKRCRELYPEAECSFLTFSENTQIFDLIPTTGSLKILTIATTSFSSFVTGTVATLFRLRRERFDVVIDLEFFSRFTSVLSFLSRARYRVGFYNHFIEGLYRGDFLTHKVFYNHYQHTALSFLDLVETMRLGDRLPYNKIQHASLPRLRDLGIGFDLGAAEKIELARKFALSDSAPLILFNPNISEGFIDLRRWPLEHFATLAQRLFRELPGVTIGIIGAPGDLQVAGELERLVADPRVINFAGKTSLRDLCFLLDASRCLVSNDSGPAHLAALADTHVITFFGPDTPMLFGSLAPRASDLFLGLGCSPCGSIYNGKRTVCRDNQCLQRITPEMVFQEIVKEW
jgi:ADP-heptose:LPS heptosyltransferase